MANENYVPTQAEVWDFLVGFKEATEAGFKRLEVRFDAFELRLSRVASQVTNLETEFQIMRSDLVRIERRLVRIDD